MIFLVLLVINVVLFPVGIWSFCNRNSHPCLFLFNFSPTVIFHLSKQEAAAAKVQEFPKRFYKRYRDDCLETFFCLLQKPLICLHFFVSSWHINVATLFTTILSIVQFSALSFSLFLGLSLFIHHKLRCIFSIVDVYHSVLLRFKSQFKKLLPFFNKPNQSRVIFFNLSRFTKL